EGALLDDPVAGIAGAAAEGARGAHAVRVGIERADRFRAEPQEGEGVQPGTGPDVENGLIANGAFAEELVDVRFRQRDRIVRYGAEVVLPVPAEGERYCLGHQLFPMDRVAVQHDRPCPPPGGGESGGSLHGHFGPHRSSWLVNMQQTNLRRESSTRESGPPPV